MSIDHDTDLEEYYAACQASSDTDDGNDDNEHFVAPTKPLISLEEVNCAQQHKLVEHHELVTPLHLRISPMASLLPTETQIAMELLSAIQQFPSYCFYQNNINTWKTTPTFQKRLVASEGLGGEALRDAVAYVLKFATSIAQIEEDVAKAHHQFQSCKAAAQAQHHSVQAVLHCCSRIVFHTKQRALQVQVDIAAGKIHCTVSDLIFAVREWCVPLEMGCQKVIRFAQNGTVVDDLFREALIGQSSHNQTHFILSASMFCVALWPLLELCFNHVWGQNEVNNDDFEVFPQILHAQVCGSASIVEAIQKCKTCVLTPFKSSAKEECQRFICQLLQCQRSEDPPLGLFVTKDDEHFSTLVLASTEEMDFGIRVPAHSPSGIPQNGNVGVLHLPLHLPFGRWIAQKFLTPLLSAVKGFQSNQLANLLRSDLSLTNGEPPISFHSAVELVANTALMGDWQRMMKGFVGGLVQMSGTWWRRGRMMTGNTASPVITTLFLDTMRSASLGSSVFLSVRPESAEVDEIQANEARHILRTFAAFKLQFDLPDRLQSVFSDKELEPYRITFSLLCSLSFTQLTLQKRWKALSASGPTKEWRPNHILLFAVDSILRFLLHEFAMAKAHFLDFVNQRADSIDSVRAAHRAMGKELLLLCLSNDSTRSLRAAVDSILIAALSAAAQETEQGYRRASLAVSSLVTALSSLEQSSSLFQRTKPLLQVLTFNRFFTHDG